MDRLVELWHRLRTHSHLNWRRDYPNELPDLPLRLITDKQAERIDNLKSVCLFLGPYRNLTTLTASVLSLHPECQVLNHAGARILPNEEWNFLNEYSDQKFRQFCHAALTMSQGGARGGRGGSILLSHAFAEHPDMRRIYKRRYGTRLLKRSIKSLVWKESEMVSALVHEHNIDLSQLVKRNERLRFLLPIRNPIDCCLSISRIGISKFYPRLRNDDLLPLMDLILEEIEWFVTLAKQHPHHFLYFFQDSVDALTLVQLVDFLGLAEDQQWLEDSMSLYRLKKSYSYDVALERYYKEKVSSLFWRHPEVGQHLIQMVNNA